MAAQEVAHHIRPSSRRICVSFPFFFHLSAGNLLTERFFFVVMCVCVCECVCVCVLPFLRLFRRQLPFPAGIV